MDGGGNCSGCHCSRIWQAVRLPYKIKGRSKGENPKTPRRIANMATAPERELNFSISVFQPFGFGSGMQKITPMLWFDGQAEEAAKFYVSVFKNSKIKTVTHYGEEPPGRKGQVMTVDFVLDGNDFTALNGGPQFKFNEAISLVIHCDTQEEIDYYWAKLTADGGEEVECGWLSDKFGLSWQVVPAKFFEEWDKDPAGLQRVMHEVMQMKKLDLARMEKAFEG